MKTSDQLNIEGYAISALQRAIEMFISNGGSLWDDYPMNRQHEISEKMRDIVSEIHAEHLGKRRANDQAK